MDKKVDNPSDKQLGVPKYAKIEIKPGQCATIPGSNIMIRFTTDYVKEALSTVEPTKKIRPTNAVTTKYFLQEDIDVDPTTGQLIIDATRETVSVNELGKLLLRAATDGDVDELKSLLLRGAAFTADWLGTSPLHLAAQFNHLEICQILLRAGISKDARTKVDRTPLHMAAYEGHLVIVETLLAHGADQNCKDMLGMTPLHWAVQNGHIECVEILLRTNQQEIVRNKFNLLPIDIARQINRVDIQELLTNGPSDSTVAAQNLLLHLDGTSEQDSSDSGNHSTIPIDTIIMENSGDQFEIAKANGGDQPMELDEPLLTAKIEDEGNYTEELKLLHEHGVTMLQQDETGDVLTSAIQSGHSMALTDIGKEMFHSVNKRTYDRISNKKIYTVTAEEFAAMTTKGSITFADHKKLTPIRSGPPKAVKKIVMHKGRIIPVPTLKPAGGINTDMQTVMTQLIQARKTIEEYKLMLLKKEEEILKLKALVYTKQE